MEEDVALRRIDRLLAALEAVIAYLSPREGRKELVLFSDGFPHDTTVGAGKFETAGRILRLAREAATAQVAINPIHTLGLVLTRKEEALTNALAVFALNSGGVLTHGVNDFTPALARLEEGTRATYILAYRPLGDPDGKYHSTVVRVGRTGVKLRAQEGFVWMTSDQIQERKIRSAYVTPALYRELPVEMKSGFYLEPSGGQVLEVALAVPGEALVFVPQEDHVVARLEVGMTFRSARDTIADRFGKSVEVRLPPGASSRRGDLHFVVRREIPPGDYDAVAVLRDLATDAVGAARRQIKVPSLATDHLAMSSLVLRDPDSGIRRVNIESPVCPNPRVAVPTVRPIFDRSTNLLGSCLLYHPKKVEESGDARVEVTAVIRRGDATVRRFPTTSYRFSGEEERTQGLPLQLPVPVRDLDPGVYTFELQVLDLGAGHTIIQSEAFVLR